MSRSTCKNWTRLWMSIQLRTRGTQPLIPAMLDYYINSPGSWCTMRHSQQTRFRRRRRCMRRSSTVLCSDSQFPRYSPFASLGSGRSIPRGRLGTLKPQIGRHWDCTFPSRIGSEMWETCNSNRQDMLGTIFGQQEAGKFQLHMEYKHHY
jgi:hypothetical protein